MPSCTGCLPTFNGTDVSSATSQSPILAWSGYVAVSGEGSYTGVYLPSGLYVRFWTQGGTNGKCTGYSGSMQLAAAMTGGSGIFTWSGNRYTCTGMGQCNVTMYGVMYNYDLRAITNSYTVQWSTFTSTTFGSTVSSYNFLTNPIIYGEAVTGTTLCGFTDTLYNQIFILPNNMPTGTTGFLEASLVIPFGCNPCLSGA